MKVDVKELLECSKVDEPFYPGKKIVRKYLPHGEHKSHCVVFDWHGSSVHVELRAGTNGHPLDAKELRHYPVSFQARTYLDIEMDAGEDEDDGKGKSGGGGKQPAMKKKDESGPSLNAFEKVADGIVATSGEITKFVVMGKEIAKEAYAVALENLKVQLAQTKIMAMDLMKGVSDIIKKATPGGGLAAHGDETIKYRYDAEKTAPMFGGLTPS